MEHRVQQLMSLPYHLMMVRDEDVDGREGWVAWVAELPGCIAQGATPEEAATAIRETMAIWFETMIEDGKPIPPTATNPHHLARPA